MSSNDLPDNVKEAIDLLDELFEDSNLPKNIRNICSETKKILEADGEIKMKIDTAIQSLDALSDDINLSVYARTYVWNIISLLEST